MATSRAAVPTSGESPGARANLLAGMGAVYRDVEAEIAASNPACRLSGECCHFEKYGHRLYASRAEALYFALHHAPPARGFEHDRCPYLAGNRCTAREGRPLGCRVFFCDPAWKGKGEDLTERTLARLRRLSDRLGIPWDYKPFLAHLDDVGETALPFDSLRSLRASGAQGSSHRDEVRDVSRTGQAGEKQEGSWPS